MDKRVQSTDEAVEEIMRIHRSLPTRPGIDEVEAAKDLILNVEKEDQARLEAIARQTKAPDVPEELFLVLIEMQKNLVYFQSKEQKREALKLLDLENVHALFDDFIQRASKCLPSSSSSASSTPKPVAYSNGSAPTFSKTKTPPSAINNTSSSLNSTATATTTSSTLNFSEKVKTKELFTRDDSYVKPKSSFNTDRTGFPSTPQIFDSTLKTGSLGKFHSLAF